MAPGKARGIKRPSATNSYSSATTIVIFVGLSILGLRLLTSNSFTPPRATTTTTIIPTTTTPARITSIGHHHSQNHHSNPDPIHVEHSTEDKEHEAAIIPEEPETKTEIDEAQTDNGGVKVEATGKQDSTGSDRQDSIEEPEKQEIQTSEESSMTQKQVAGQIKEEKPVSETNVVANEADHGSETTENQITDEDQQQRIDEHQKQGDEQNQQEQDQQQQIDEHQKQGDGQNQQEQDQQQQIDEHQKQEDEQNQQEQDQQQQMDEHQKRGDVQNQREQEAQSKDPNGATSHAQIQHDEVMHVDSHQDVTNQEIKQEQEPLVENGDSSSIPEESTESKKSWTTQAHQSEGQKERRKTGLNDKEGSNHGHTWLLCNVTAGADYIPCLDNEKVIANIHSRSHHEHRERHCPEDPPTCLVPLPQGYKKRIDWPQSRDKIWYNNVPHTSLAEYKGHQNWVKVTGEFLTFPGGGTQFIHGALHYIEFLQEAVPDISWGKHTRVVLDVGCGVASFGGYLFEKDVITISFAPKDEHEAQVQFALERGIPAISAVMGSQRLPFPSRVFDVVHCARCRVPWHADGGALLLELNRVLRPGGYFVWSATPVYQKLEEDVQIWKEMSSLTVAMCWELVTIKKDKMNSIGAAIYQKPDSNDCYDRRKKNEPPMCKTDDDPNAAWYILLQSCMHRIPTQENERGSQWPEEWPERLMSTPYWLNKSQMGIYGKPAPDDFLSDYEHWKKVVNTMYMNDMGINWSEVRNAMDLRAVYGGFAAALRDQNLWVMNVVNIDSPDTLPIIYERGLFGIYHDWCESFSTYPRSYDLLHADHLFSKLKERCTLEVAMAEIDRILRPGGKMIVRDEASVVAEVLDLLKSLHWEVFLNHSKNQEGILSAQKSDWRPTSFADSS